VLRDKLIELLEPVIVGLGYELWELEFAPRGQGGLLRIYLDSPAAQDAESTRPDGGQSGEGQPEEGQSDGNGAAADFVATESGITVEDCARVSRAVSEVLDEADPIPGQFTLEVSSPGLDRVLRTHRHFQRFIGARAEIEMREALRGRRRFLGRLAGVDELQVTLEVEGSDADAAVQLPLASIHKARLAPEF